ncbi:MAG: antitoxin [Pseudomonas sp.]|uniref:type II toxin-antitoxin system RelB family antitoxin n=1 Tax=Pseudomonas sp. WS 5412 TaxID=2717487 RepID=UPI003051872E
METSFPSDIPADTQEPSASYDHWFRSEVNAALDDPSRGVPHDHVMAEMRALIDAKVARHSID